MAEWIPNEGDYQRRIPGQEHETRIQVSGVLDATKSEPPKLVLADHPNNKGISIGEPLAREEFIRFLSQAMRIQPHEADWFFLDSGGKLHTIAIGYEQITKENPSFAAFHRDGEFDHIGPEKARKHFPDIQVNELRTSLSDIDAVRQQAISRAFAEGKKNITIDLQPSKEQAHTLADNDYDLSKERI